MSCPDWRSLDRLDRLDRNTGAQAGWTEAVAHFDAGCPLCRRAALAAEPTLVFRRLGSAEMSPSQEAAEVDSVRQAVAAMRTASRVDSLAGRSRGFRRSGGIGGRAGWTRWTRWAAAAALAVAALAIPGDGAGRRSARVAPTVSTRSAALATAVAPAAFAGEADLPTVEGVNRPGARVYHLDGEGLSVVMIVDETLDV